MADLAFSIHKNARTLAGTIFDLAVAAPPVVSHLLLQAGIEVEAVEKATRLGDFLSGRVDAVANRRDVSRSVIIGEMATAAGISSSTVSQILGGTIAKPPEARLAGFARVLGGSAASLMRLL